MWEYVSYDELYHHGIKGMEWGVRRYQNADGSLTPAGKKRYYDNDGIGLTREGKEAFNREYRRIYETSTKLGRKIEAHNKEYQEAVSDFKKAQEFSKSDYESSLKEYMSGNGKYKKLNYYRFKDAVRDDWVKTDHGKQYYQAKEKLKTTVESAVKDYVGESFFNKPYAGLTDYYPTTAGKKMVDAILNDIQFRDVTKNK